MSLFRSHEEKEAIATAEAAYEKALAALRSSPANVVGLPAQLEDCAPPATGSDCRSGTPSGSAARSATAQSRPRWPTSG